MTENDCRIDYVEFNVADVARAKHDEAFGWLFKDYFNPASVDGSSP